MPRGQHPSPLPPEPPARPDIMSAYPYGSAPRGQHPSPQPRPRPDIMSVYPYGTAPPGQHPAPLFPDPLSSTDSRASLAPPSPDGIVP